MRSWTAILCILALVCQQTYSSNLLPFMTLTNTYQSNRYKTTYLTSSDRIKVVITWPGSNYLYAYFDSIVNGVRAEYQFPGAVLSANSKIFEQEAGIDGQIELFLYADTGVSLVDYNVQFFINGVLTRIENGIALYDYAFPINKFVIAQACRVVLSVSPLPESAIVAVYYNTVGVLQGLAAFGAFGAVGAAGANSRRRGRAGAPRLLTAADPSIPDYQSTTNQLVMDIPTPGVYYVVIIPSATPPPIYDYFPAIETEVPYPFTITLQTTCDSYCVNPSFPTYKPDCQICGNGILEDGEECDNGNKTGCIGCFIAQGYTCIGNPQGTSQCTKPAVCGDGVLDSGEQCDNGRRTGCSTGCTLDSGYKCTGSPSVCSFCGNGIVETGEECDNKNSVGCSVGCKVDIGFECRGTSSYCTRKNPVCGNNVIEIAESCDDGNNLNGDGCSQYCFVEKDFICSGQFGESSKCQKSTTPTQTCGNGIVETGEQCDNYGQVGCTACKIESGWDCLNVQGFPSACWKIVLKDCGNGVYESNKGQACDDGNVVSGDGCSSLCQREPGWLCFENRVCVRVEDPSAMLNCGNGKVESQYNEVCDDGNKVDGDGCNRYCKVENGWSCRILTFVENKSYCTSSAGLVYCGNGIVDSGETCDDGFPLLNNDGCNVSCQQEPGWDCQSGRCVRI